MPLRRRACEYRQISDFTRGRIIELREDGASYRQIAR